MHTLRSPEPAALPTATLPGALVVAVLLWGVGSTIGAPPAPAQPQPAIAPEQPAPPLTLDQWHFHSDVVTTARPGTYVTGATANFTQLLRSLGTAGEFDLNSVRVAEVVPGGRKGLALPSTFQPETGYDATSNAAGTVLWEVSPTVLAGWERRFRIYFDTVVNGPKPPPDPGLPVGQYPTFIPNGDFEEGTGRRLPGGWDLRRRWGAERVEVALSAPTHALRLRPGQAGWAASVRTPGSPGIVIDPGQHYTLSFRYVLERSHPRGLQVSLFWFDSARLPLEPTLLACLTDATKGWKRHETELTPPRNASYLSVVLSTESREGTVLVDDVALAPLSLPALTEAVAVAVAAPEPSASPVVP